MHKQLKNAPIWSVKMIKGKKAIGWSWIVALIIGVFVLFIIIWIAYKSYHSSLSWIDYIRNAL